MYTDKLFVVFGSDSRFEYTAKALREKGLEVCSFGDLPPSRLNELKYREKALVLPLPYSRDSKSVNLPSLPYTVTLKGVLSILKLGDLVFAGMPDHAFKSECEAKGALCFDYYNEEMILDNAELTAKALLRLLDELEIDKSTLKFAVTGFGRTAKAIAKTFSDNGIDFIIVARSEAAETAAKSMNFDFVKLENFTEETLDYDVIINTVPALIFDHERLSALKSGVPIIDIASSPFGVTEQDAEKYSVPLIRALSLPGKYCPEEAGLIIAHSIEKFLKGR